MNLHSVLDPARHDATLGTGPARPPSNVPRAPEEDPVSKPVARINRYKADLRELHFLLFEQFKIQELLGKAPFEAWGEDEVRGSIAECYRFVREVLGPLNAVGDAQGCRL